MTKGLLLGLLAGAAFCQNPDASPAFESVDVHVSPPSKTPAMRGGMLHGGRYELHTATMVDLIGAAYSMESNKILGGPNWLDWDRFDVIATAPGSTPREDLSLMLRKVLADRFKLVVRKDLKPMPVFALIVSKGGKPKMKAASGSGSPDCKNIPQTPSADTVPYQAFSCQNFTMAGIAEILGELGGGSYLADPVVDRTELGGTWDFELKWTARNRLAQAGSAGISLFDAVDRQLGLKLEPQKIPQPVLLVETVNEAPTPNDPAMLTKIPPPPPTEFEVATIRPSAPDARGQNSNIQNGRLALQNFTLRQLIRLAWDLSNNDEMMVGLPDSADSAHYDVVAKAASSAVVKSQDVDFEMLQVMLRGLLAERFGLKAHMEDRPVNAYTLTAGPQLKLQKADPQNRTNCKAGSSTQNPMLNRLITCQNMNMTQFALLLQNLAGGYVRAPIREATGIEGYWDFAVNFSGVNLLPGAQFDPNANAKATDPNGSLTLPEAVQKQLGLKLEMGKHPIPVMVVDHVEDKPTEN